jgi:hypothetical protein
MIYLFMFISGMAVGHYISPWIDDKIADLLGEGD